MKTTEEPIIIEAPAAHHDHPLESETDLDVLMSRIGDSRYVLVGEASHGTHEYYTWRSAISKKLIEEKGFSFIAVEGDWPDCYQINRFVKGYADVPSEGVEVLKAFRRWPGWMWGNWEITALLEWMRKHNAGLPTSRKTGFYGHQSSVLHPLHLEPDGSRMPETYPFGV